MVVIMTSRKCDPVNTFGGGFLRIGIIGKTMLLGRRKA